MVFLTQINMEPFVLLGKKLNIIPDTLIHELPAVFTGPFVELVLQPDGMEIVAVFHADIVQKVLCTTFLRYRGLSF